MIAVITGDIINSRSLPQQWIDTLKASLSYLDKTNCKWEIYRGDSFQIELDASSALLSAIYIKACLKTLRGADVRIGIGLGKKSLQTKKITEASGEAYINSGEAFDTLKRDKVNLALKSPWQKLDDEYNLFIKLALIAMDGWGQIAAQMVKYAIENENLNQQEIAKITGRSQSSVSEALKRAHFTTLMELVKRFENQLPQ